MQKEFETQVLDVDVKKIKAKLRALGAKETPEKLQKRWVFDLHPCTANSEGEWIRLRQAGADRPTITYKNRTGKGWSETDEIEVEVSDFGKTAEILDKVPFKGKYYQENKRAKFVLDDIEFTLDTWPMVPTILEVEAKSERDVKKGLKMLDLEGKDAGHIGTIAIYKKYGIDLHGYKELKF